MPYPSSFQPVTIPDRTLGILSTFDNPILPYQLKTLHSNGFNNVVVFIDSRKESPKGLSLWQRRTDNRFSHESNHEMPTLYSADAGNYPFYLLDSHISITALELYSKLEIACLYNGGTPRKIPQQLLDAIPLGIVNVHPGHLPYYRGCSCVEWAINNNHSISNTSHFMTASYDQGPIIDILPCDLSDTASYVDIRVAVYKHSCEVAAISLRKVLDGSISLNDLPPQDESQAMYWPPMPPDLELGVIKKANSGLYRAESSPI